MTMNAAIELVGDGNLDREPRGDGSPAAVPTPVASRVDARAEPRPGSPAGTLLVVALYALAMAWVESAVVFYMRSMIHRMVPYH